ALRGLDGGASDLGERLDLLTHRGDRDAARDTGRDRQRSPGHVVVLDRARDAVDERGTRGPAVRALVAHAGPGPGPPSALTADAADTRCEREPSSDGDVPAEPER